jgi:ribosomal protein S18 acetylase RimI-like enzyme
MYIKKIVGKKCYLSPMNAEDMHCLMQLRLEMLRTVNNLPDDASFSQELVSCSEDYFASGDQTTVLAYDGDIPVGCASISYIAVMPTYSHPTGKRAHLMNVYVKKEYRGRGTARTMVQYLIEEAKKRQVTEISLDATDMGRPLYEAIGFTANTEGMVITI